MKTWRLEGNGTLACATCLTVGHGTVACADTIRFEAMVSMPLQIMVHATAIEIIPTNPTSRTKEQKWAINVEPIFRRFREETLVKRIKVAI